MTAFPYIIVALIVIKILIWVHSLIITSIEKKYIYIHDQYRETTSITERVTQHLFEFSRLT